MREKYNHLHQYIKVNNGKSFKCTVPACHHMINGTEIMLNRQAACPYCMRPFVITAEHLRRKTIHCMTCSKSGKPVELINTDMFNELLSGTLDPKEKNG